MQLKILGAIVTDVRGYKQGDLVYWPDAEDAARLIAAGFAEAVVEEAKDAKKKQ